MTTYRILSTGNTISADRAFVDLHYLGDYEEIVVPIPQDDRLRIAVTSLSCDQVGSFVDGNKVSCLEGAVVTAVAELHYPDDNLVPLTALFHMPMIARDGREYVVRASFVNGVATISATMRESGYWQITEAAINSGLPEEMAMAFSGIDIIVGAL